MNESKNIEGAYTPEQRHYMLLKFEKGLTTLGEIENLMNDYLRGDIDAAGLGTDIITRLVYLREIGIGPTPRSKCLELLETMATAGSDHVPASRRLGEATYALRELGERFAYHETYIRKFGCEFNRNNEDREYSLTSLLYTKKTEGKKKQVRVEFDKAA